MNIHYTHWFTNIRPQREHKVLTYRNAKIQINNKTK